MGCLDPGNFIASGEHTRCLQDCKGESVCIFPAATQPLTRLAIAQSNAPARQLIFNGHKEALNSQLKVGSLRLTSFVPDWLDPALFWQ